MESLICMFLSSTGLGFWWLCNVRMYWITWCLALRSLSISVNGCARDEHFCAPASPPGAGEGVGHTAFPTWRAFHKQKQTAILYLVNTRPKNHCFRPGLNFQCYLTLALTFQFRKVDHTERKQLVPRHISNSKPEQTLILGCLTSFRKGFLWVLKMTKWWAIFQQNHCTS